MPPPGVHQQAILRTLLWLVLGGWVGSWGLFALVIARVAFQVLPSDVAGGLVSPVLTALHLYGAAAGIALAALARLLGRGRIAQLVPLAASALCLYSHFVVTAEIAALGDLAFGPEGSTEIAARFGRLHGLSMGIFSVVWASALGLVALHAWSDATHANDRGETPAMPPKSQEAEKNA